MSKSKRPVRPVSDLISEAEEAIGWIQNPPNPTSIKTPAIPIVPLVGIPLGTAVFRKTEPFRPLHPSWQRMHDAINARDKALAKHTAAWYDTPEGKKLEDEALKARIEYWAVRKRTS